MHRILETWQGINRQGSGGGKTKGTKVHFNKVRNDYEVDQWFSDAAVNTIGMIADSRGSGQSYEGRSGRCDLPMMIVIL
jgi:hypothetical protein